MCACLWAIHRVSDCGIYSAFKQDVTTCIVYALIVIVKACPHIRHCLVGQSKCVLNKVLHRRSQYFSIRLLPLFVMIRESDHVAHVQAEHAVVIVVHLVGSLAYR